ncbi:hypothetical protein ACJJTC_006165 [Scirpophaga incertulas]
MEEVVKEKEERLAEYKRLGIGKKGEECEKGWKKKYEVNEEIVKELENRMKGWREKYMEKERKLREIEKDIEEYGINCGKCEDAQVQIPYAFAHAVEAPERGERGQGNAASGDPRSPPPAPMPRE